MIRETLFFVLGSFLGGALLGSALTVAHDAVRGETESEPTITFGATFLVASWGFAAVGYLLLALGWFSVGVAVALTIALVVYSGRIRQERPLGQGLRGYASSLRSRLASTGPVPRGVIIGCGSVGLFRLFRLLGSPPHQWDSMTYHLVKAVDYVQTGAFSRREMPEAWTYYRSFPDLVDVYSAWAILPVSSDVWVDIPHMLAWLAFFVGAFALLREFDVEPDRAIMGACAIGFVPAVWSIAGTPYAASWLWGFTCWGLVFIARWSREPKLLWLLLAAAALSLAAATKTTGLVVLAVGGATLLVAGFRNGTLRHPAHLALVALIMLPGAVPYMRAWIEHGSPFYPMPLAIGPLQISEGNLLLQQTHALTRPTADLVRESSMGAILRALIFPYNFGAGFLLFAPVALLGAKRLSRRHLWLVLPLAGMGALLFGYAAYSPGQLGIRTIWVHFIGRHILPVFIAVVAVGALARGGWARVAWTCGIVATLLSTATMYVTREWHALEGVSIGAQALIVAFSAACVWAPLRLRWRPAVGVAGLALGVLVLATGTFAMQKELRWRLMSFGALGAKATLAEDVDAPEPQRIAVAAGPPISQDWTVYPYFGSRLQNSVLYIPPSDDAKIRGYSVGKLREHVDDQAWFQRLRDSEIDFLVVLSPPSVETEIMGRRGLAPLPNGDDEAVQLYDVRDSAAK